MKDKIESIIDDLYSELDSIEKTASSKEDKKTELAKSLIKIATLLKNAGDGCSGGYKDITYDDLDEVLQQWTR